MNVLNNIIGFLEEYVLIIRKQVETFILRTPPASWQSGTKGDVILIQGFAETWVFLKIVGDRLNTLGYRIHVIHTLGRNLDPVEVGLQKVQEYIDVKSLDHCILLSHSKGGIIAKLLVDDPKYSAKILQVINIAVPYGGTVWGRLHVLSLHQQKHDSIVTRQVKKSMSNNSKIINIFPRLDNHVLPHANTFLEGAKNIQVDMIGHTRILDSLETCKMVEENLV